jgi:hypothetical protein
VEKSRHLAKYHFKGESSKDLLIWQVTNDFKSPKMIMTFLDMPLVETDVLNKCTISVGKSLNDHTEVGKFLGKEKILKVLLTGKSNKRAPWRCKE